jgi:hypothetical protein
MLTTRVTIDTPSATQRAVFARALNNSTTAAPAIGSQINKLNRGQLACIPNSYLVSSRRHSRLLLAGLSPAEWLLIQRLLFFGHHPYESEESMLAKTQGQSHGIPAFAGMTN